MCISYFELNQLKEFLAYMIAFFYLTFWTIFASLNLILQFFLEKSFQTLLQLAKGIRK
jgi:hypothetical protein